MLDVLFKAASAHDSEAPRPTHEGQIATLLEVYGAFARPNPYRPGDLVMPRRNSDMADRGEPHIVLEVLDHDNRVLEGVLPFTSRYGVNLTMRVAVVGRHGSANAFWVEPFAFEPYAPPPPLPGVDAVASAEAGRAA